MNAGTRLQKLWRWNGRPVRIRITRVGDDGWRIAWERWFPRANVPKWQGWRAYIGVGTLAEVIAAYRDYADGWRGFE